MQYDASTNPAAEGIADAILSGRRNLFVVTGPRRDRLLLGSEVTDLVKDHARTSLLAAYPDTKAVAAWISLVCATPVDLTLFCDSLASAVDASPLPVALVVEADHLLETDDGPGLVGNLRAAWEECAGKLSVILLCSSAEALIKDHCASGYLRSARLVRLDRDPVVDEAPRTSRDVVEALGRLACEGGDDLWNPVYERVGYRLPNGGRPMAAALAKYLACIPIPDDPGWIRHLPSVLAQAFRDFRTLPKWLYLRDQYIVETGHELPDLVDAHCGGTFRVVVVESLAHMMAVVLRRRWVKDDLTSYFGAQERCVDQAWRRFTAIAYRDVLAAINKCRGQSGVFGRTRLLVLASAGRVVFTFCRGTDQVSVVADESDELGWRSGLNALTTPYRECVDMIEDVVEHWSIDGLKPDNDVWLI